MQHVDEFARLAARAQRDLRQFLRFRQQRRAGARPFEQRRARGFLEARDATAHRRRVDIENQCSLEEAAGRDDLDEGADVFPVDAAGTKETGVVRATRERRRKQRGMGMLGRGVRRGRGACWLMFRHVCLPRRPGASATSIADGAPRRLRQ